MDVFKIPLLFSKSNPLNNIETIDVRKLTLDTPIYNYYYGEGKIESINEYFVKVEFENEGGAFLEYFHTLENIDGDFTYENRRYISELQLTNDF